MERDGSGRGRLVNGFTGTHEAVYDAAVTTLAQNAQIEIVAFSTGASYFWPIVRATGQDATRNNIQVSGSDGDNNIYFTRTTNGVGSDFASFNRGTPLALSTLRVEIDGNGTNPQVKAVINGTTISTQTYTGTLNNVGDIGYGIFSNQTGASSPLVDNFAGGDFLAAAVAGTIAGATDEDDIRAGGRTITITLDGSTWIPA